MNIKFYFYDVRHVLIDGKSCIELYGINKEGNKLCIVDEFNPYFYAEIDNDLLIDKISKLNIKDGDDEISVLSVHKINKKILGIDKELIKIVCNKNSDIHKIRNEIKYAVLNTYEFDIPYTRRYLVDKQITPLTELSLVCDELGSEDDLIPRYKLNEIEFSSNKVDGNLVNTLKILAIDIETYYSDGGIDDFTEPILMISFYSNNFKKVITWKEIDGAENLENEKIMLERFCEIIKEINPDFITGYFSDSFDFPYIKKRADMLGVSLKLGDGPLEIKNDSVRIKGIVHIDILKFIRRTMSSTLETQTYSLNDVAKEVLGEKKLEVNLSNLSVAWDEDNKSDLKRFVEYNLKDSKLTYELFMKIFPNLGAMVNLTSLIPFDVNKGGFSQFVEWYIIYNTKKYNEIILSKPNYHEQESRREFRIQGAYVAEPRPGIYKDIIVLDFTSLYPSVITTHNISLDSLRREPKSSLNINPENDNLWFSKKEGYITKILSELILMRKKYKKELKNSEGDLLLAAKVGMLKILANSFYGYLAFYGARWYCLECASSTTAFCRYYIKKVISETKDKGFDVIYSDTDSVFLTLGSKTKDSAFDFLDETNKNLPGIMELDYEGYYPQGLFVLSKSGVGGAKKRYSLLKEDGTMKIVGFELVRRNTSPIVKEVQKEVLNLILKENSPDKALKYVKNILDKIKSKQISNDEMIITTKISKPLDQYSAVGPHVVVARSMEAKGNKIKPGSIVKYIIKSGEGIIREKASLPEEVDAGDYDSDYYINNQIIPAVEQILRVCGYEKDQILGKGVQKGLGSFF